MPAEKTDWILRQVPCRIWIIVPVPVVMQPRLIIKILPLKPYRIAHPGPVRRLTDRLLRLPPRLVLRRPRNLAFMVGQLLRRTQMIALIEGDLIVTKWFGLLLAFAVP